MNAQQLACTPNLIETPSTKRGMERRVALLVSGNDLFLKHGYDAVSLDDIVQHAGGSKATIYKYFGNKEGLFTAICDYRREQWFNDICAPFDVKSDDLKVYLNLTLLRFYQHIIQPENIAFLRLFMEQSQRNVKLAEYLYDKCATHLQLSVASALQSCHNAGLIYCEHPTHSAVMFLGILGDIQWMILMGLPVATHDSNKLAYISHSVDLFIKAHRSA